MSHNDTDPFPDPPSNQQPQSSQPPPPQSFPGISPAYGAYPAYGSYGAYPPYAAGYNAYNAPYGLTYNNPYAPQRQNVATQLASGAQETGEMVLSGMHEAMSRFARVSALIEEVLRNLHMLFDAVFGLGYSLGAFRQEARLWLAVKTGPVAFVARLVRRLTNVWRLLCIFFMSPLAGRYSPVALVLRILGLVPEDDLLDLSLTDLWRATEHPTSQSASEPLQPEQLAQPDVPHPDSSNM